MKKFVLFICMTVCCALSANAQAQINFDKQTNNKGSFPET